MFKSEAYKSSPPIPARSLSHILVLPLRNFLSNLNLEQTFLENVTRNWTAETPAVIQNFRVQSTNHYTMEPFSKTSNGVSSFALQPRAHF